VSTATPVSDLTQVEDGTDLAVLLVDGKIERWHWTDGVMVKDDHRLPPFFFSGLLKDQKIMPGNFSPPVKGEWFSRPGSDWSYLVVKEKGERTFRCAYFRRGNFYDWRDVTQTDLIDACTRVETPEFCSEQFLRMTDLASEENEARAEIEKRTRNMRDARNNIRYARDYLNAAFEVMDREMRR